MTTYVLCLVDEVFTILLKLLFSYSYELGIMHRLLKSYNLTIHCIDDVFTLNNSKFDVDLINPIELEIKYTTDITRSTSYLDLHIDIENWVKRSLKTKVICNFPL
jgi:hypothetical protein